MENRSIKFRAYDAHNKVMKFYTLKELADEDKFGYDTEYEAIQSGFDNYKWMEWTGLKDKNGKEIYEGDIVRLSKKDTRVIGWWEDIAGFGFVYQTGEQYQKFSFDRSGFIKPKLEVIGNIYENPELLAHQPSLPKD